MGRKYQIKTMQKDIKEVRRKEKPTEQTGKPPGEPIPTEPIEMKKPLESLPPEPTAPRPKKIPSLRPASPNRGKLVSRRLITIITLVAIVLLIGGGFYYWWNYLRAPEKSELEIPAFLVGADDIEIIELLEINIPTNVSNVLEEKYTFFLYAQKEGNRAGVVVKIIDHEVLVAGLKDWEEIMEEDLRPIFLGQEPGEPANEEFQDGVYLPAGEAGRGINIRYLNFSEPSLAIDYAVIEDYLIITTSKESMFKTIERILE